MRILTGFPPLVRKAYHKSMASSVVNLVMFGGGVDGASLGADLGGLPRRLTTFVGVMFSEDLECDSELSVK